MDGVIGGFQSGYNYQFGQWVLGLETDIQASGQKGSTTSTGHRARRHARAPTTSCRGSERRAPAWASWCRRRSCSTARPVWPMARSSRTTRSAWPVSVRDRELQGRARPAGPPAPVSKGRSGAAGPPSSSISTWISASRPHRSLRRSRHGLQLEQPRDRQHRARRLQLPLGRRRLLIADKLLDPGGRLHPQAAPLLCAHGEIERPARISGRWRPAPSPMNFSSVLSYCYNATAA